MATIIHGPKDKYVRKLKTVLDEYERENPGAVATLYRQNTASVRIRIVDSRFAKMTKGDRHDKVWDYLTSRVDEDTMQEISVLLLLSQEEQNSSFMNFEFNDPIPSGF
jgi:stress-induced morphogen